MKAQTHYAPMKAIVNIGKYQLTTSEESVLIKALNFATAIKRNLNLDLIVPIKEAALKIPKTRTDELRWTMRQALEKASKTKHLKGRKTGH